MSDNLFRFLQWRGFVGKFFCLSGRCGLVVECGFAHVLWAGARNDTRGAPFGLRLVEYVTRQGYNMVGNDPCCRSVPGECYLLTTYNAIRECRDSACRRPFGVRRNAAGVCSEMTPVGFYTCLPLLVCRDSACWRPFGVRLRGNVWLQHSPLHGDAAPLRMTQWVNFCVGDTMSIRQSILATNRLYLTERYTLRVILSGAAQILKIKR